jgi:DNA-binding transcriptional MocR family regulator
MYYTIPTFHNPTGILFTPETCTQLVRLARNEDFLIACDDVYNLIGFDASINPPKRLFAYDNDDEAADFKGNVISNGSFSKILSPGIRMGWMECPPRCTELFRNSGVLKSGGAANNYTAGVVGSMIELGLAQRQLTTYVGKYKERMLAVCKVLDQCLPKSCSFLQPGGGYFIWIVFPESFNAVEFNNYCLKYHRVVAIAGSRFSVKGAFQNCLRITIAFHEKEVLEKAVKTMCEAIDVFEKLQ